MENMPMIDIDRKPQPGPKAAGRPALFTALAALAGLALCLPPRAQADDTFYQRLGNNNWNTYDYMNYVRYSGQDPWDQNEWGFGNFPIGNSQKYFLRDVNNWSGTAQCFEVQVGPPNTHSGDATSQVLYYWDEYSSSYVDLLGGARKGKIRLYVQSADVQFYVVGLANTNHAGYWVRRMNLTESQCTTGGQATMNWLKAVDNRIQAKYVIARR